MTTTPTPTAIPNAVVSRAHAAFLVVQHAERSSLPLPVSVRALSYEESIDLHVRRLDALTQWAIYLDTTITSEPTPGGRLLHEVKGTFLDQSVCVWTMTDYPRPVAAETSFDQHVDEALAIGVRP